MTVGLRFVSSRKCIVFGGLLTGLGYIITAVLQDVTAVLFINGAFVGNTHIYQLCQTLNLELQTSCSDGCTRPYRWRVQTFRLVALASAKSILAHQGSNRCTILLNIYEVWKDLTEAIGVFTVTCLDKWVGRSEIYFIFIFSTQLKCTFWLSLCFTCILCLKRM